MNTLKYLALGDSYTIGEGVKIEENFPNQFVKIVKEDFDISFETPEIVATTGWTTDELSVAIKERNISGSFDFVTLLIGVNNQYRNRDLENFKQEFSELLKQAISFADMNYKRVVVLSIPDWGHTPYALEKGFDEQNVADQIKKYNEIVLEVTLSEGVRFLDITTLSKTMAQEDRSNLTEDGLHYSPAVYKEWAACLAGLAANLFCV
ncbi:MAG TPA: SGNH/GDSL hydrolase family protein [Edaphocola sp.]|nr:SGNH/GDSL hydrolase family protein [Edaphocola sp.]